MEFFGIKEKVNGITLIITGEKTGYTVLDSWIEQCVGKMKKVLTSLSLPGNHELMISFWRHRPLGFAFLTWQATSYIDDDSVPESFMGCQKRELVIKHAFAQGLKWLKRQ
ncbi:MAG: hypothetical protein ABIE43_04130 [Patescibacteria group bacterium]